jgi:hypothetical protein
VLLGYEVSGGRHLFGRSGEPPEHMLYRDNFFVRVLHGVLVQ